MKCTVSIYKLELTHDIQNNETENWKSFELKILINKETPLQTTYDNNLFRTFCNDSEHSADVLIVLALTAIVQP